MVLLHEILAAQNTSTIESQIMSNQPLGEELHKPIIL